MDSAVVDQECLHSKLISIGEGVVCKLDWSFPTFVMERISFEDRWIKWILASVSSAHLSIMVNGSPKGFFHMERGIRQSDPLSPFLYVLVAEGLHLMLNEAKK